MHWESRASVKILSDVVRSLEVRLEIEIDVLPELKRQAHAFDLEVVRLPSKFDKPCVPE